MIHWKRSLFLEVSKKIYSLLGLAAKAGRLKSGEFMTEQNVKAGKGALVIVASDASDNTKKNFNDMCTFYKVPILILGDKESLGHAIGKEMRASIVILDEGFASSIQKQIGLDIDNKSGVQEVNIHEN